MMFEESVKSRGDSQDRETVGESGALDIFNFVPRTVLDDHCSLRTTAEK